MCKLPYGFFFILFFSGSGDGTVLQLLFAGAEAGRLRRDLLAQVEGEDDGRERQALRRRLRHLLSHGKVLGPVRLVGRRLNFDCLFEQVLAGLRSPDRVQPAGAGQRRGIGRHAESRHDQGQHRPRRPARDERAGVEQW